MATRVEDARQSDFLSSLALLRRDETMVPVPDVDTKESRIVLPPIVYDTIYALIKSQQLRHEPPPPDLRRRTQDPAPATSSSPLGNFPLENKPDIH